MSAGAIADMLLAILQEAGIEFGIGPLANATTKIAKAAGQLGFKISEKTAERILDAAVAASGAALSKVIDDSPLAEVGREAQKADDISRACAFCGTNLSPNAHPNRRYCDSSCRSKAAYQRRARNLAG